MVRRLLLLPLTIVAAAASAGEPHVLYGTDPVVTSAFEAQYPVGMLYQSREGYALIGGWVGPDGRYTGLKVRHSHGGKKFERATIDAASQWRFEAGTWNGSRAPHYFEEVYTFTIVSRRGADPSFARLYRATAKLVDRGDTAKAEKKLAVLIQRAKTLYEFYRASLLRARFLDATGRTTELRALLKRLQWTLDDVEPGVGRSAAERMVMVSFETGAWAEALAWFRRFDDLADARGWSDEVNAAIATIRERRADDKPHVYTSTLDESVPGYWFSDYRLLRHTFKIDAPPVSIDHVIGRCNTGGSFKILGDLTGVFSVPAGWDGCLLKISGVRNTPYTITELPLAAGRIGLGADGPGGAK